MIYFLIWIGLGVIGAMIANSKGNSGCSGFVLGVLLGPIGLLITYFSSDNESTKRERSGNTKKCPYCAEFVKQEAIVCKHCGRNLREDASSNIDDIKNNI